MRVSQLVFLNRVEFGLGAVEKLPEELRAGSIARPLLITDSGVIAAGIVDRIHQLIGGNAPIFSAVPPNPTKESVARALEIYCENECDGVVAIGGGSPIDLAKAVVLLATHEGPLERYALIRGGNSLIGPTAPVIAIPTTAGTGSEVGRGTLIALSAGSKLVFASKHLLPTVALCDPSLTVSLPASLTAATGMDAFTHCIEAYLSPRFNPPVDAIVLSGAQRAWKAIVRAFDKPKNLEARSDMMMASIEGGLGFQKGLGAVHALSHPLGALPNPSLHHGTCNAVILPFVLQFNQSVARDRIAILERALDLPAGLGLVRAVQDMNKRLGLPASLREMGVPVEIVPTLVRGALADHSRPTNPRTLDEADINALYAEMTA